MLAGKIPSTLPLAQINSTFPALSGSSGGLRWPSDCQSNPALCARGRGTIQEQEVSEQRPCLAMQVRRDIRGSEPGSIFRCPPKCNPSAGQPRQETGRFRRSGTLPLEQGVRPRCFHAWAAWKPHPGRPQTHGGCCPPGPSPALEDKGTREPSLSLKPESLGSGSRSTSVCAELEACAFWRRFFGPALTISTLRERLEGGPSL